MRFEILGKIRNQETMVRGARIRELPRLRKFYGKGHWRKRKGIAEVQMPDGSIRTAELHWYEALKTGKIELKIKRFVD